MARQPITNELKPAASVISLLYKSNPYLTIYGPTPSRATGTVFVMNQGTKNDNISIALVPSSGIIDPNCWICYRAILAYGHSLYLQEICLGNDESIYVESYYGTSSFIFTGNKII
jgi:hypothetical protein